jgi:LacI family transcriptional regulator
MLTDKARKATIRDVAALAGVTAMTVSRVLNGSARVLPETRSRIQKAIDELGYVPNALARGLLTGRTRTIGLLVGDLNNPYWTAVASGAEETVRQAGYSLVIGNIGDTAAHEEELVKTMLGNRVEGLLINAPVGRPLKRLAAANYPFVLIGPEHRGIRTDVVRGDVYAGIVGLTSHLLGLRHRNIALLNGPSADFESRERLKGFRATIAAAGIDPDKAVIANGSFAYRGGYDAALTILRLPLEKRPTAIVASNNFLALSVIEAARAEGLRIPEDMALACFDDFVLAAVIDPFLTVMSQPARKLGMQSAELLLERLAAPSAWTPRKFVNVPQLIVRRSCGAGSAAPASVARAAAE